MHIDHFNISAPAKLLRKEKKFLCEVFDLIEGERPKLSQNGYWLYSKDKALIHLIESNDHYRNEKQGYLDHVAFQLSGLNKLINTLNILSTEYTIKYSVERDMTQVFFKTPAGIGLEAIFLKENISK
jgi:hypothetical protein